MLTLIKNIRNVFNESRKIMKKEDIVRILIVQNRLFFYHILVIVIFSIIYYYVSKLKGTMKDKEKMNTYMNCFYFTTITHFTIGFGDIVPESNVLRILVMSQVLIAFILMNR